MGKTSKRLPHTPWKLWAILSTIVNIVIICGALWSYWRTNKYEPINKNESDKDGPTIESAEIKSNPPVDEFAAEYGEISTSSTTTKVLATSIVESPAEAVDTEVTECLDDVWCSVQMPKKSYFKFSPPTDVSKWKRGAVY